MVDKTLDESVKDFYSNLPVPDTQVQGLVELQEATQRVFVWRRMAVAASVLTAVAMGFAFFKLRESDTTRAIPVDARNEMVTVVGLDLHGDGCTTCSAMAAKMKELRKEFAGQPVLLSTLSIGRTAEHPVQQKLLEKLLKANQNTLNGTVHPSMVMLRGGTSQPMTQLLSNEEITSAIRRELEDL